MCMIDIEECDCICHREPGVSHIMNCCFYCEKCGKNIQFAFWEMHQKQHEEEE